MSIHGSETPKATTNPRSRTAKKPTTPPPTHDQIARLAEKYWAERGRPDGSPEQDWLRAEEELRGKAS
jgi:hypothetical protein